MKRRLCRFLAALSCTLFAGCSRKVLPGGGVEFGTQSWVPLLFISAGAAAAVGGVLLLCRKKWWAGAIAAIVGLAVAGVLAPGLYLDRVIVNDEGFESSHGFWWARTVHKVRFDDLSHVQGVVEERTGRRGRKEYSYYFACSFKSRGPEQIPLGDLMREALPDILAQFQKHNVPVAIPPNMPR